jgi:hypothetical protein
MSPPKHSSGPDDAWPPPIPPELKEFFDAMRAAIHPPPEEEERMRRDLEAVLIAEERRIDLENEKKEARKRTAIRAAVVALLAAAVGAMTVSVVVAVAGLRQAGPAVDVEAALSKNSALAWDAGAATSTAHPDRKRLPAGAKPPTIPARREAAAPTAP